MNENQYDYLETKRLFLKRAKGEDSAEVWPHTSDPEISRDMSWDPHRSIQETEAFLKRVDADWHAGRSMTWVVRYKETGELSGLISIIAILRHHRALTYQRGELAYWCARNWQRQGIMTEAAERVIQCAFAQVGLNRLVVAHHAGNTASERLIRRLGFRHIGSEHESFQKNGRWIDTESYELLKADWREKAPLKGAVDTRIAAGS